MCLAHREHLAAQGTVAGAAGAGAIGGLAKSIQEAKAAGACMAQRLCPEDADGGGDASRQVRRGAARDAALQAAMDADESVPQP